MSFNDMQVRARSMGLIKQLNNPIIWWDGLWGINEGGQLFT